VVARDLTGPPDKLGSDIVTAGDCGQDRAIEAVKYALATDFSPVINWALIDMPDYESADEEEKALMLGFFKGLTELAVIGVRCLDMEAYAQHLAERREEFRQFLTSTPDDDEDEADE
jgi:hypothetical protein